MIWSRRGLHLREREPDLVDSRLITLNRSVIAGSLTCGKSSNLLCGPDSAAPQLNVHRHESQLVGNQWLNSSILPEACPLSAPCESREELRVGNVALFLLEANWKSGTVTLHLWFIDKAEWMTCIINEWLWVAVPKRNKTKSGKIKYLAKKSNRSYCKSHLNGPYFPKH